MLADHEVIAVKQDASATNIAIPDRDRRAARSIPPAFSSPTVIQPSDELDVEEMHSPLSETLAAMPSWMPRMVLYVCAVFLGIGVAFSWLGRIDVVTTAPAVVVPRGRLKPVQSELEGLITELLVKEGDPVTAGQPLAAIDSPDVVMILAEARAAGQALEAVERELRETLPLQEAQLRTRIEGLHQKIDGHQRTRDALNDQRNKENTALELTRRQYALGQEQQDAVIARLVLERKSAESLVILREKKLQAVHRLLEKGVVTEFQEREAQRAYDESRMKADMLIVKKQEAERQKTIKDVALRSQINTHEKALATIVKEIAESEVASQTTALEISQLQDELKLLRLQNEKKRDDLAFRYEQARRKAALNLSGLNPKRLEEIICGDAPAIDRHFIRSPIDGVVGSIGVTEGETAQRGGTLMMLIPRGETLVAEMHIPNREMGQVREGLVVRFKFDAFPYAKHGAISGRLRRMVTVADRSTSSQAGRHVDRGSPRGGGGSYYRGYCVLDQDYFRVRGRRKPLLPGMTATAEVVTGRKRIVEILLQPLLEFQQGRKAEH